MLTEKEEKFLVYWAANRDRLGSLKYQITTGLPLALLLGFLYWAIIKLLFYFHLFGKAEMSFNADSGSLNIIIILGIIIFGLFFSVYSKKFNWDNNDGFYQSLLTRKNKPVQTENT